MAFASNLNGIKRSFSSENTSELAGEQVTAYIFTFLTTAKPPPPHTSPTSGKSPPSTRVHKSHQLLIAHVQQLIQVHTAEGELAERSPLLAR